MVEAPERLTHVTVPTTRGDVVIPWSSQEALLAELGRFEFTNSIRAAFNTAGASRPVQLTPHQKHDLAELIHLWCRKTRGGFDGLPLGMRELWRALKDDLHGTAEAVD